MRNCKANFGTVLIQTSGRNNVSFSGSLQDEEKYIEKKRVPENPLPKKGASSMMIKFSSDFGHIHSLLWAFPNLHEMHLSAEYSFGNRVLDRAQYNNNYSLYCYFAFDFCRILSEFFLNPCSNPVLSILLHHLKID